MDKKQVNLVEFGSKYIKEDNSHTTTVKEGRIGYNIRNTSRN